MEVRNSGQPTSIRFWLVTNASRKQGLRRRRGLVPSVNVSSALPTPSSFIIFEAIHRSPATSGKLQNRSIQKAKQLGHSVTFTIDSASIHTKSTIRWLTLLWEKLRAIPLLKG